ncbi:hypothetical protein BgiMline_031851, partial [Biomphalaria glabrata]
VGTSMCGTGYTGLWTSNGLTVGGGLVTQLERKERLSGSNQFGSVMGSKVNDKTDIPVQ